MINKFILFLFHSFRGSLVHTLLRIFLDTFAHIYSYQYSEITFEIWHLFLFIWTWAFFLHDIIIFTFHIYTWQCDLPSKPTIFKILWKIFGNSNWVRRGAKKKKTANTTILFFSVSCCVWMRKYKRFKIAKRMAKRKKREKKKC